MVPLRMVPAPLAKRRHPPYTIGVGAKTKRSRRIAPAFSDLLAGRTLGKRLIARMPPNPDPSLPGPPWREPRSNLALIGARMSFSISLTVNGVARTVAFDDPRITLLDLLRERLDLTGTKKG